MKTSHLLLALVISALPTSAAVSGPTTFSGDGTLGDFSATIQFTSSGADSGTLKVTLTNNPTTAAGGMITAFAFNNPGNAITGVVAGAMFAANFQVIGGPPGASFQDGIQVSPLPNFDIGASISDEWLGGGNPNQGIAAGSTETFEFALSGTGVGALTESDFVNELVNGSDFFAVRFRGFENGGSDKVSAGQPGAGVGGGGVGGGETGGGGSIVEIPEPSSLLLALGLAVIGLGGYTLRRCRRCLA